MKNLTNKGSSHQLIKLNQLNFDLIAIAWIRKRKSNEEEGGLIPQTVQDRTTYERNMLHQLVKCSLNRFPWAVGWMPKFWGWDSLVLTQMSFSPLWRCPCLVRHHQCNPSSTSSRLRLVGLPLQFSLTHRRHCVLLNTSLPCKSKCTLSPWQKLAFLGLICSMFPVSCGH